MRTRCEQRRACSAGFTLLELLISATVFVLVAGAVVTTLSAAIALNSTNRETILATQAAESALEALKGTAFDEVFVRYNATAADDPANDPSPGSAFAVQGLGVQEGDADGLAGEIQFPGDGLTLREDADDLELGMPRDLSGEGNIDANDHAADYRLLPVRAVVEWQGRNGARRVELVCVLSDL